MKKFLPDQFKLFSLLKPLVGLCFILFIFLFVNAGKVLATSVSNVTFTPDSYLGGATTKWTFTFSPATTLPGNGSLQTISVVFPTGFDVSNVVIGDISLGNNFGTTLPYNRTITGQTISFTAYLYGPPDLLTAGNIGTFTISNHIVNASPGTYSASGFTIYTYLDTTPTSVASDITLNPSPPTVTSPTSASITSSTATLGGNVTSDGGGSVTERGVCVSTSSNPTTSDTCFTTSGTTGVFTVSATGLNSSTTYHYRAYATNSGGTGYSTDDTFLTLGAPFATTNPATSISASSATLNGTVSSNGYVTTVTFKYSTVSDLSSGVTTVTATESPLASDASNSSVMYGISGLSNSTTYYFRVIGANSVGTTNGAITSFTTDSPPSVSSPTNTSITGTTATLGGNVTSDGGDTVTGRGVCVSTSSNPTTSDTCFTTSGTTGVFTVSATGLNSSTTYHYRAYATNSVGTTYSSDDTFTTDSPPSVSSPTNTSITGTTATLGGNVTSDGGDTVTGRGVCVSTSSNPTTSDTCFTTSGTTGVFTVSATSLLSGITYHYRAYATNSIGTSYSSDDTFLTSARYWVGGTGNWSDTDHWSTSSGGSGGASLPDSTLTAYFDVNSFSATGQTVTIDMNAISKGMDWTGALYNPTLSWGNNYPVFWGSLTFISGMTMGGSIDDPSFITLQATTSANLTMAGKSFPMTQHQPNFGLKVLGGTWNQQDAFVGLINEILIQGGTWVTNDHDLDVRWFAYGTTYLGSSNVTVRDYYLTGAPHTVAPNLTIIPDYDFVGINFKGEYYETVHVYPSHGAHTTGGWQIQAGNTPPEIGELILEGGPDPDSGGSAYYPMNNGGVKVHAITVNRNGALAYISGSIYAMEQISTDYLGIENSTCSGVTPCYAGSHSVDLGGNTGWVFTAPPATATTVAASSITTSDATLSGTVNGKGDSAVTSFIYGTSPTLSSGTTTVTASGSPVSGSSNTSVSYALTNLNPGTTYYYRVSITNSYGTTNGSILSFATMSLGGSSSSTVAIPDPGQASYWRVNQPFNNTLTIAGSSGGTIGSLDNKANLVLGAGANSANANTFFWLAPRTAADVLAGNSVAGKVSNIPQIVTTYPLSSIYELDPSSLVDGSHISTLSKPVTMTLNVSKLSGNVAIQYYDPVTKKWSALNTFLVVNSDKKDVSFVASKAGLYVAVEAPSINNNATQSVNQPTSTSSKEKPASKEDVVSKPSPTPAIASQAPKFIVNSMANLGVGIINSINNGSSLVKNAGSKISGIFNFGNVFRPSKSDKVLAAKTVDLRNAFSFRFVFPKINISIGNPSDVLGASIIDLGYKLVRQPTEISDLHVEKLASDSAVISWKTNDPADSKVSFGFTPDYGQDVQSGDRVVDHKITVKGLKPGTTYFYEVMSQGKTYVYDARHEFKTPSE